MIFERSFIWLMYRYIALMMTTYPLLCNALLFTEPLMSHYIHDLWGQQAIVSRNEMCAKTEISKGLIMACLNVFASRYIVACQWANTVLLLQLVSYIETHV